MSSASSQRSAVDAARAEISTAPEEAASLTERVLACVERIPAGRVMSYGDVAEYVGSRAARQVGRIMALDSYDGLPWHRVLRADGRCAEHLRAEQVRLLRAEGVPFVRDRVDMVAARWDGR